MGFMRILILLLTSMLFYACGNGNFFNDEPYNGLDLATECGCYDFLENQDSILHALGYDDYDDYEKWEEGNELIKKCYEVVKVFDDEELKTKHIDVERNTRNRVDSLGMKKLLKFSYQVLTILKIVREFVIENPYYFVYAHDPKQEIIDVARGITMTPLLLISTLFSFLQVTACVTRKQYNLPLPRLG